MVGAAWPRRKLGESWARTLFPFFFVFFLVNSGSFCYTLFFTEFIINTQKVFLLLPDSHIYLIFQKTKRRILKVYQIYVYLSMIVKPLFINE